MDEIVIAVRTALRLGTTSAGKLEEEIRRNIRVARAELARVGVPVAVAQSKNELIIDAIVAYCQMKMGNQTLYERYKESWEYQADNLRKSTWEETDVQ